MSQKIIIADNYAVFRTGTARFVVVEDDFSIVGQCDDLVRLYKAAESNLGTIVLFASSLEPDLNELVTRAKISQVKFVAVLDKGDSPQPYMKAGMQGILYRDVSRAEMLKCLRSVARGVSYVQQPSTTASARFETDMVGERAKNRLSAKELQIIGLIVQGYKNKDIAAELNNSEQVIKNYLRSIFDKTGVSDRLELALFTIHHRILLEAVGGTGGKMIPPPPGLLRVGDEA
ncbi:MAG: response regulator transcription factor [Acidobacteriota bacterium]